MATRDLRQVRILIEEILTVCKYDDTGVTFDLLEPTYRAAIEIGITKEELEELANKV